MKYVIHQKHYSYDDEYIAKDGRSVHSVKHFSSEEEAKKEWVRLEKDYIYEDDNGEECFTLGMGPVEQFGSNFDIYRHIFNVLLDNGIKSNVSLEELRKLLFDGYHRYDVTSKELPVLDLPNDVFLELLIECGINRYILSKYESVKNWVLYFYVEKNIYGEKGYLTYFSEPEGSNDTILCESNIDALFEADEFQWGFDEEEPLTT